MSGESPGTLIGPYEVIQRLEGQASEIYLARRHGQERGPQFVLILFEVGAVDARIIQADAERCRTIDHRAITRLVEMFEHGAKWALVFDSVPGTSLHRVMLHLRKDGEKLADGAAFHIGKYLFGALAKAHVFEEEGGKSAPIVHGQLGPHQVILSWSGAITIMGFGMSRLFRLAENILAEPDELKPFMAPEQRAGYAPTARANVYSAAAIMWSLLANELPPSDGSQPESLLTRRPDIPRDLSSAIDQALEPAITQRTITAHELETILGNLATGDGRRELEWNMEVFKEGKPAEVGFIPPESVPPSPPSDVPAGDEQAGGSSAPLWEGDIEPTANWKVPEGLDVHSPMGKSEAPVDSPALTKPDKPHPNKKIGRAQSIGAGATKKKKRRQRQATLLGTGAIGIPTAAGEPEASAAEQRKGRTEPVQPAAEGAPPKAAPRREPPATQGQVARPLKPFAAPPKREGPRGTATPGPTEASERPKKPPAPKAAPLPPPAHHRLGGANASEADAAARDPRRSDPEAATPSGTITASDTAAPTLSPTAPVGPVAPLPPPVIERAPEPRAPEPTLPGEEEDDDEGFYVRPSLRPGALGEAPFLTPSLHPATIGGPPFGGAAIPNEGPMSMPTMGSAFAQPGAAPGSKLSTGGLPLKWTAAIAITAVLSFAAGLLVASGPVQVKVGQASVERAPAPSTQPNLAVVAPRSGGDEPANHTSAAATTEPATESAAATAAEATEEPPSDAAQEVAGADGSDLPQHEGYFLVRSPDRSDAHVYVHGHRMGEVGQQLTVPCGLVNVRLGNHPLNKWYGRGHAVQVECQSVTDVTLQASEELHPGAEHKGARGAAPKSATHRYWVPSSL